MWLREVSEQILLEKNGAKRVIQHRACHKPSVCKWKHTQKTPTIFEVQSSEAQWGMLVITDYTLKVCKYYYTYTSIKLILKEQ